MRDALGDSYTEAIRAAYPKVPDSADFVMFWWEKAALAARAYAPTKGKGCRRFGLIITNSLRQTFNRKVLETLLNDPKTPASLIFAIPDHPWVDAGDGVAVRIAMTVAEKGRAEGRLFTVATETKAAAAQGEQTAMDIGPVLTTDKAAWPKTMPEQIATVRAALTAMGAATPDQIARHFARARTTSVQPLLESLAALGYATRAEGGRFLGP